MKNQMGRALWTTSLALLSVGALFAQDVIGTWQGTLTNAKGKELRLVAKISREKEKLAATFYSIDQEGARFNAGAVTQQGRDLKMELPAIGGSYEAKLSEDNNTLVGTFTQGQPFPLNLVRATPDTAWAIPDPPAPAKPMAADADPSFEVATIKPAANASRPGSSILVDRAGMFTTTNTPLKELLVFGFGVHPDQIEKLPEWAANEKYDIVAKPDHEGVANETQLRTMLRKLLVERFALKFHRETKELTALTLNLGRTGHKLTANTSGGNLPGFGGRGPGSIGVVNSTMDQFAGFLQARIVDRPVVNKTGIEGKFDFTLTWRPEQLAAQQAGQAGQPAPQLPPDIESRPDIYTAMQEQLGLRFQSEKTPVEVLIVDTVQRPSDN